MMPWGMLHHIPSTPQLLTASSLGRGLTLYESAVDADEALGETVGDERRLILVRCALGQPFHAYLPPRQLIVPVWLLIFTRCEN